MQKTIYTNPVIRPVVAFLAGLILKLRGWKVEGEPPKEKKYVIIAVPHKTNWDFPLALSFAFVVGYKIYWMGKSSLFNPPWGGIMRWLGGIPVDRSKKNNLVDQMVGTFDAREELSVVIPPEGTRSTVKEWKTGFYHIANGANVPIILGFIDYKNKIGGLGPAFYPTGDKDADFKEIRKYYINRGLLTPKPEDLD